MELTTALPSYPPPTYPKSLFPAAPALNSLPLLKVAFVTAAVSSLEKSIPVTLLLGEDPPQMYPVLGLATPVEFLALDIALPLNTGVEVSLAKFILSVVDVDGLGAPSTLPALT